MNDHNKQEESPKHSRQQNLPLSWGTDRTANSSHSSRPEAPMQSTGQRRTPAQPRRPDEPKPSGTPHSARSEPATSNAGGISHKARETPAAAADAMAQAAKAPRNPNPEPAAAESAEVVRLGDVETSLGQTLLEARGARNMSVTQVSQKTKIPRDFIEHVEADRLDLLPPPVYARSYISQLCREYGVAPAPLLDEYQRRTGHGHSATPERTRFVLGAEPDDAATVQYRPLIHREVVSGRMLQTISRFAVLGALVLLVLLVLSAVIYQQINNYRMRRQEALGIEPGPPQTSVIDLEEYITPQHLPLVELTVPSRED